MKNIFYSFNTLTFLVIITFLLFISDSIDGQDVHYIQLENTPLIVNPANAGMIDGNHRLLAGIRDQSSAYLAGDDFNAEYISYDARATLSETNALGLGISLSNDRAGTLNFGTEQLRLFASFIRDIKNSSSTKHSISFGVDLGLTKRKIDLTNARWPSQHDGNGGFDPTRGHGFFRDTEFYHLDLGLGILWKTQFGHRSSVQGGIAMHHLNKANVSFLQDEKTSLAIKTTFQVNAEIEIGSRLTLTPNYVLFKQASHSNSLLGTDFRFYADVDSSRRFLSFGYRMLTGPSTSIPFDAQSHILVFKWQKRKFNLGFSYDFIRNEFRSAGISTSAWEVTLGFVFAKPNTIDIVQSDEI